MKRGKLRRPSHGAVTHGSVRVHVGGGLTSRERALTGLTVGNLRKALRMKDVPAAGVGSAALIARAAVRAGSQGRRVGWLMGLCICVAGCVGGGDPATGSAVQDGLARIGRWTVSADAVAGLAQRRGVSVREAWSLVRSDGVVAHHYAKAHPRSASAIERLSLAKALLSGLREQAESDGPPTVAELQQLTSERFWEMTRPRLVQVVHAVVLSEQPDEAAKEFAGQLREAAVNAESVQEFADAVKAVDSEQWNVKVESLQPVALDGRSVHPDNPPPAGPKIGHLVRPFAEAAHRLNKPGQLSEVVRTDYGYHVLMLHKQWPAQNHTPAQIRAHYRAEVMDRRTATLKKDLLERLTQATVPRLERSALEAMTQWPGSL